MNHRDRLLVRPTGLLTLALAAACATDGSTKLTNIEVRMKPEEAGGYKGNPNKPFGELMQDYTHVKLAPSADGTYTLEVEGAPTVTGAPVFPNLDLRWFVPRVPALAKGDPTLTKVALMQREFNRNETKFGAVGQFAETKIANNCLRSGLWEVVLEKKKDDGSTGMKYHGWFDFPAAHYAALFQAANGMAFDSMKQSLAEYPAMGGFAFPLQKLRTVAAEKTVTEINQHLADPVESFAEQKKKAGLVLTPDIKTYADFVAPAKQPIQITKFSEPGYYNLNDPISFDLAWMAQPKSIAWRKVTGVNDPVAMDELEITYANGNRILVGDAGIAGLKGLEKAPEKDSEVLRLTFGICTPDIYATLAERKAEFENPRANYLLLLDAAGNHLDNHTMGCDRVFVWRTAGSPGELQIALVGYERTCIVSHLSIPFASP